MNETVESIFGQMFAPNEIPQQVVDLYARTKFFLNRIDVPDIPTGILPIIAAVATSQPAQQVEIPNAKLPATIDTTEDQPIAETEPAQPSGTQVQTGPPVPGGAPTGPMDAPATALKNPATETALMRMTKAELRAHCRDVLKYRPRIDYTKHRLIAEILKRSKK
jgi:hypothetical protein